MVSVRSHTTGILARAVGSWPAAIGCNDWYIHSSRRGVVALKDMPSTSSRVSRNVSLKPLMHRPGISIGSPSVKMAHRSLRMLAPELVESQGLYS
jgi:hypothetical protein